MTNRRYATPLAWKQALEARLRQMTPTGAGLARQRQILVHLRFLARVFAHFGNTAVLKGGMTLQCRSQNARATKDVDLCLAGNANDLLARLQQAARADLGDYLTFEVRPHDDHPEIQNEGLRYDGRRFIVTSKLAGKPYGNPFGVDVVVGEPIFGASESMVAPDVLGFAGVPPPTLTLCPLEAHIAEKLHAYTLPRSRPNSRVKDLPDLALLSTVRALDAVTLRSILDRVFAHRGTHPMPTRLPDAPATWSRSYVAMARDDGLPWPTLDDVVAAVRAFLDPVLEHRLGATWSLADRCWRPH
ncbi:MAG: nucleotidyl transferase AbiEii/AbiGii toxin family protein [Planctomycetes bacterium]|nr:nucleotidyl transferase AbiEii/AbiGii toxin family protein [Planctomycetota bacterium]